MIRARGLLRMGHTAAEAARITGLSKGAISQDVECAKLIEATRHEKMLKVHAYIKAGVTWKGACAEFGVTQGGYSKWRKKHGKVDSEVSGDDQAPPAAA
jgi:hypothetical protein